MVVGRAGDHHAAGLAQLLQPGGDVDPVAEQSSPSTTTSPRLTPIRNTIRRSGRRLGLAVGHGLLHRHRAGHRIDHRGELDDRAVAHQLDDAALVLGQQRVDRLLAQRLDRGQRAGLVLLDQARVADHVGGQDRGQPALGARRRCRGLRRHHLGRQQVAVPRHGLEHLLRLVAQRLADVAHALGDQFVTDHHVRPDRGHDRVAVHNPAGVLDQEPQQREDFGRSGTSAPSGPSKARRPRSRVKRSKRQAPGGVRSASIDVPSRQGGGRSEFRILTRLSAAFTRLSGRSGAGGILAPDGGRVGSEEKIDAATPGDARRQLT